MNQRVPMTDKDRKENQPYDIDVIPAPTHPSKTTKAINKLLLVAMVLITLSLGLLLKWSFQAQDVLVVNNSPFPTRTIREHPTAGGVIILTADYCKKQNITGITRTSFISASREVFLPVAQERGPEGCYRVEVPVIIPKDLPADTYKIKFTVTYDINPLKKNRVVTFESTPVEVDPTEPTQE